MVYMDAIPKFVISKKPTTWIGYLASNKTIKLPGTWLVIKLLSYRIKYFLK